MSPPETSPALTTVAAFAQALGSAERPPPADACVTHGDLASRFAVYRNNVWVARLGVLDDLFPVARRLGGDDFFHTLGRRFFEAAAPTTPVAVEWAAPFAAWLSGDAAVAEWPWLVDVVRLEAAWIAAHEAAEAEPLGPADFAGVAPEALLARRLLFHPSLALVASAFPVGSIWMAHHDTDEPGPLATTAGETVLVVRPDAEVVVAGLAPAEAAFVGALVDGTPLGEAGEAALAVDPDFDVGSQFVALVRLGAVTGIA